MPLRKLHVIRTGQGLLEGVVAIGVLITGLVSVVTLTRANLTTALDGGNRLTATNLAREGIEAVRSVRDGNWLMGRMDVAGQSANSWDVGLVGADPKDTTAVPLLDPATLAWSIDFGGSDINDDASILVRYQGLYIQQVPKPTVGTVTIFRRLLILHPICRHSESGKDVVDQAVCPEEFVKVGIRIESQVKWNVGGSQSRSLTLEDRLYNWRFAPAN